MESNPKIRRVKAQTSQSKSHGASESSRSTDGEIAETHRCIAYILEESPRMTHQDSLDAIALIERIKEKIHG